MPLYVSDEGRKTDPNGLAPFPKLDYIHTAFSSLTFTHLALGQAKALSHICLGQARALPGLSKAGKQDFVVLGCDRFLHGPLTSSSGATL